MSTDLITHEEKTAVVGVIAKVGGGDLGAASRGGGLIADVQRESAAVSATLKNFEQFGLSEAAKKNLCDLVGKLTAGSSSTQEKIVAEQAIVGQLKQIGSRYSLDQFEKIINNLSRITKAQDGPEDLLPFKEKIARDVLLELSNPSQNLHQGHSVACAITAREYRKNKPEIYCEFIADVVNKGYGHIGRDSGGTKVGLMEYESGKVGNLYGRTMGDAIYQDILLKTFGSPEQGLMPADVERFFEARGVPAVLLTAAADVSNKPGVVDDIVEQIKAFAQTGVPQSTAVVSLDFGLDEHAKHVLEICSSQGVPSGYIKLSNPWQPGTVLPDVYLEAATKGLVIDNRDGTLLIKDEFLKGKLYFAVLETKDSKNLGVTAGVKEGEYAPTQQGVSYFGFAMLDLENDNRKKTSLGKIASSQGVFNSKKETTAATSLAEDRSRPKEEVAAADTGKNYFESLTRAKT